MRVMRTFLAASLFCVAAAAPAAAQPTIGGGWAVFSWSGLGPVASWGGTFGLTSANPFEIRIVDCCVVGDVFRLSWTGTAVGSFDTSAPGVGGGCFSGDGCWAIPGMSKGSATYGAGTYTYTLETIALAPGFSSGSGFIRADETVVPEPATWLLMGTGMAGLLAVSRRRRA